MSKNYIVLQRVWKQVSSDYDTAERTRARVITKDTTIGEIMQWASLAGNTIGKGDLVLIEEEE